MQRYRTYVGKSLAVLTAMWGWIFVNGYTLTHAADPNEPVASVNSEKITRQDLAHETALYNAQMAMHRKSISQSIEPPTPSTLVEKLINRKLLIQKAAEAGIKITPSMINIRFSRLKKIHSAPAIFKSTLDDTGLNEKRLKLLIKQGLTIETLLEQSVFRSVFVSQDETKTYYSHHHQDFTRPALVRLNQILVRIPSADASNRAKAIEKIDKILERIESGDSFSAMAVEYSDGPNRFLGGDSGYLSEDELAKPLRDSIIPLESGEISPIIETEAGFHLLKVVDKKPPQAITFKHVQKKIHALLTSRKQKTALNRYLKDLKQKAIIERYALN